MMSLPSLGGLNGEDVDLSLTFLSGHNAWKVILL